MQNVDGQESIDLRLGSTREDDNEERKSILAEVDRALIEYGACALCPLSAKRYLKKRRRRLNHKDSPDFRLRSRKASSRIELAELDQR